jgi:hypothetical protein
MRQPQRDIPSAGYGEGVETAAIQAGAPLSATGGAGGMQPQPIPFSAPTQRPDEPITSGIDMGPGPGSNILGMKSSPIKLSDTLASMLPYDPTGEIAVLYQAALSQGN